MKPKNNVYNDLKEISKEAREEFQEYNRQGPQYRLADYNTALCTFKRSRKALRYGLLVRVIRSTNRVQRRTNEIR